MLKKGIKSLVTVPVFLSIIAVLVSACGLVYQFISKDDQWLAFLALLISNITLLVANLTISKNKKDKTE